MKKRHSLSTLVVLALLLLAGCAGLPGPTLGDGTGSDADITANAADRLNRDSMTGPATLGVTVENGLATLYGSVPDEATRQRAIQILENTPGIFEVLDRTRRR